MCPCGERCSRGQTWSFLFPVVSPAPRTVPDSWEMLGKYLGEEGSNSDICSALCVHVCARVCSRVCVHAHECAHVCMHECAMYVV